jgi:superfamily II DNA or RNA helicase
MNVTFDGLYGQLNDCNPVTLGALRQAFSVDDPDKWASEAYRKKYWDGRHHAITAKGFFLRGLTQTLVEWLSKNGVQCTYKPYQEEHRHITASLLADALTVDLEGITLAEHQRRMVSSLLAHGGGTVEGVTGSGKTESIALLMKLLSGELDVIFVLVHRIGLMDQSHKRFCLRCPEFAQYAGMLGDGKRPREEDRFIFSTQQSLSSALGLSARGQENEFLVSTWEKAGAVIIDECHNVTQDDYLKLLSTISDKAGVYQFSGTPETNDQLRDWTIVGVGGPIVERVRRPELERKGFIAKAVACLRVFDEETK